MLNHRSLAGLLLIAFLAPAYLHAQDVSGTWHGELVRGANERILVDMELVAEGGRITGTSRVSILFQPVHHARMALEGRLHGGTCQLSETQVLEHSATGYPWVMQAGVLRLDTTGVPWRLYGAWQPSGCAPGKLMLLRTGDPPTNSEPDPLRIVPPRRVEGRKVKWAAEVELPADSVLLFLYDDRRVDGDTVTLFLNGICIARNLPVPDRGAPCVIPVTLVPGINYLVMQAENLGREPPNTAGLFFQAGGEERRLVLRAEPDESAGVRILREPNGR